MLYQVGTQKEILSLQSKLPECIIQELLPYTIDLDVEYGIDRDYLESGGYALIAENIEDMLSIQKIIDYTIHPCEWVDYIDEDRQYLVALYMMNNDFSIAVVMPTAIAPEAILNELED